MPEVPKYLLVGKGFTFNTTYYALIQEARLRGYQFDLSEDILISGHYHNGLLTTIIPFGIWGVIGFIWFCVASLRVLLRNYRHGDSTLKNVNTFLLSFFIARLIYYLIF